MNYHFYLSSWNPNGTQTLFITNEDGQIVEAIEEACFGVDVLKAGLWTGDQESMADDESIFLVDKCPTEDYRVWQVHEDTVLRSIAASPVDDGNDTAKTIYKYLSNNPNDIYSKRGAL